MITKPNAPGQEQSSSPTPKLTLEWEQLDNGGWIGQGNWAAPGSWVMTDWWVVVRHWYGRYEIVVDGNTIKDAEGDPLPFAAAEDAKRVAAQVTEEWLATAPHKPEESFARCDFVCWTLGPGNSVRTVVEVGGAAVAVQFQAGAPPLFLYGVNGSALWQTAIEARNAMFRNEGTWAICEPPPYYEGSSTDE